MSTAIILPEMGEGIIEGTISRWLKQVGDKVEEFEPLLEIETDKVTTEAVAETAGVLLTITVQEGETVAVGTVLGHIGQEGETTTTGPSLQSQAQSTNSGTSQAVGQALLPQIDVATATPDTGSPARISHEADIGWVSPVVARMAAEHSIDLTQISGTGRNGRITKRDVQAFLDRPAPPQEPPVQAPAPPAFAPPAPPQTPQPAIASPSTTNGQALPSTAGMAGELMQLSNMRRAIAAHMVESKHTSPHVTTIFEADFSAVMTHRQTHKEGFARKGIRLTFTPYLISAIARALNLHPQVNSSWREDGLWLHRAINVGMATAIDQGLIVPVIKHADELNLAGLSRMVNDLAHRARHNQLKPDEVKGGTFTLTNHGTSGSLFATPIINQPQCGILGVGAIQKRVVVVDDMIAIRPMSYLSFTFDHRILDGASADHFVAEVKRILEGWPSE